MRHQRDCLDRWHRFPLRPSESDRLNSSQEHQLTEHGRERDALAHSVVCAGANSAAKRMAGLVLRGWQHATAVAKTREEDIERGCRREAGRARPDEAAERGAGPRRGTPTPPDAPKQCLMVNQTSESVSLVCGPGYGGGLVQRLHMEVSINTFLLNPPQYF